MIIIGGGPAGITAGIYAARHNLKTLLMTKGFGGQMARKTVAIENYTGFEEISGFELVQKFEKHLRKQKIDIKIDAVVNLTKNGDRFSVLTKKGDNFLSKAVILTTGAEARTLDVPGEKEFIGRGVSYCVACDGPLFAKKIVAVAGGGNAAFEAALFLAAITQKIFILERGKETRADEVLQKKAKEANNIEILTGVGIKEIAGEKFVNSIKYEDSKTGEQKTLKADGIFVEIGNKPEVSFAKDLVDFNEKGEIIISHNDNQTKTPGLFAAGDVTTAYYKQIIISAGDGAKAALSAQKYIRDNL